MVRKLLIFLIVIIIYVIFIFSMMYSRIVWDIPENFFENLSVNDNIVIALWKPIPPVKGQQTIVNLKVSADWDQDNLFNNSFSDITSDILSLNFDFGRDHPSPNTGLSVAGILNIKLKNFDGKYSEQSSEIPGKLKKNLKIKVEILNPMTETYVEIWNGQLDEVTSTRISGDIPLASLRAFGPLYLLTLQTISTEVTTGNVGILIHKILDDVDWPASKRSIDLGHLFVNNFYAEKQIPLKVIRDLERLDLGFIHENPDGILYYETRTHRQTNPRSVAVQGWYGKPVVGTEYISIHKVEELNLSDKIITKTSAPIKSSYLDQDYSQIFEFNPLTLQQGESITLSGNPSDLLDQLIRNQNFYTELQGNPDSFIHFWGSDPSQPLGGESLGSPIKYRLNQDHSLSVLVEGKYYGQHFEVRITNQSITDIAILSDIELWGKWGYSFGTVIVEREIDEQTGEVTQNFSQDLISEETHLALNTYAAKSAVDQTIDQKSLPKIALRLSYYANKNLNTYLKSIDHRLSDRIAVDTTVERGIGIKGDFYIEKVSGRFSNGNREMLTTLECSYAGTYTNPGDNPTLDPNVPVISQWHLGAAGSLFGVNTWLS